MSGFYSEAFHNYTNWLAWTHSSALFIPLMFIYFSNVFPRVIIRNPAIYIVPLIPFLLAVYLSFSGNSIAVQNSGLDYQTGPLYLFYQIFLVLYFFTGYILLFFQNKKSDNLINKKQVRYVLIGSIMASVLAMVTDLIFPYLQIFNYTWLGPVFTLIMVASIFIAILRYNLFNIQVIISELFSFVVLVLLIVNFFMPENQLSVLVKSFASVIITVFLYLFIRAVYKIEKLAEGLAIANERQKSLMHVMNHQIKDYIGKARSIFAELLSGEYGVFSETAKPLLDEGFEKSTKGVDYLQGILRGASAATGVLPYDMKPMNARQVAETVIAQERTTVEERSLSFESHIADGDYNITGDAVQLGEAFKNLIANAAKYNTPGGSVKVDLRRADGKIIFSVKDTGIGVSDEDKSRLFTFGGMGKNSIKVNVEAAGFGLAFVKGVAEANKGIAGYKPNDSGKGSTFFVELPVNPNIQNKQA